MSRGYINTVKKIVEMAGKREIIVWGMDLVSKCVIKDFLACGIDIKYFVSDKQEDQGFYNDREVKSSIELFLEDKKNVFICVVVLKDHGLIYQKLIDMGYIYQQDFFIGGIAGYFSDFDVIDSMLGYNRYYNECLGFKIYGDLNNDSNAYKIMTLGGSTTDPTMGNNKCWSEWLYEKMNAVYDNVIVINGGMGGYSVQQEFLKFVRDGIVFQPDLVITFDGYNNLLNCCCTEKFPYLGSYEKKVYSYIESKGNFAPDTLGLRNASKIVHGLKRENKEDFEHYIETIKNMNGVLKSHDIEYLGFFQPIIGVSQAVLGNELLELLEVIKKDVPIWGRMIDRAQLFHDKVWQFISKTDYMYDLSTIFDGKRDMFYDHCHATDEGNEVIAEAIFKCICLHDGLKEHLEKLKKYQE